MPRKGSNYTAVSVDKRQLLEYRDLVHGEIPYGNATLVRHALDAAISRRKYEQVNPDEERTRKQKEG